MANARIKPGKLSGNAAIPPSKSQTMRALLFAAMANGKSEIKNYLPSPDTSAMIDALRLFVIQIEQTPETIYVEGGRLRPASDVIQCGNSGQVLRFAGALAALLPAYTILTGDASIRSNRPIQPLIDGLSQLGAFAASSRLNGYAPLLVKGPIKGGHATIAGEDSQPVSALLLLGAFAPHPIELTVKNAGEKPWVGLTLSWFDRFGIPYENRDFESYSMKGGASLKSFKYSVPGDFSSAAFFLTAALATQSEITLDSLDMNEPQGDKAIIQVLQQMGAQLEIRGTSVAVKRSPALRGIRIDVNELIDALPILAVAACFAEGKTEIVNGAIARKKESDRIQCIATELKKMGADIEEKPDGLIIRKSALKGAVLETYHDHRLAMALSIAALGAKGESTIRGIECASKSYPSFFIDLASLAPSHVEIVP